MVLQLGSLSGLLESPAKGGIQYFKFYDNFGSWKNKKENKIQRFDGLQLHRSATKLKPPQLSSCYNAMFCEETLGPGIHMDATWHTPPIQTPLWTKNTPAWWWHSLMAVDSAGQHGSPPQKLLRSSLKNTTNHPRHRMSFQILQIPTNWADVARAGTSPIYGGPTPQHTGTKGSATNGHPHRSNDQALTSQSCLSCASGTYTISITLITLTSEIRGLCLGYCVSTVLIKSVPP